MSERGILSRMCPQLFFFFFFGSKASWMVRRFFSSRIRGGRLHRGLKSNLALLCISVHTFARRPGSPRAGGHAASRIQTTTRPQKRSSHLLSFFSPSVSHLLWSLSRELDPESIIVSLTRLYAGTWPPRSLCRRGPLEALPVLGTCPRMIPLQWEMSTKWDNGTTWWKMGEKKRAKARMKKRILNHQSAFFWIRSMPFLISWPSTYIHNGRRLFVSPPPAVWFKYSADFYIVKDSRTKFWLTN